MTTTEQKLNIIDFLPRSLIELDRKEGTGLLDRFLNGPQDVWKIINDKIWDLLDVNDPDLCPDVLLQFRKDTVGFTSELDYITENLSDTDLRKLIRLAMTLWRLRGGRAGMRQSLFAMTGRPIQIYDWFDKRYELTLSGMGFIRDVKTDSNLLRENLTIDKIEEYDGETSSRGGRPVIFTSSEINFRERRVVGGETLFLSTVTAPPYIERIETYESFQNGEILENVSGVCGDYVSAPFGGGLPSRAVKIQNIHTVSGARGARTRFEEGLWINGGPGFGPDFSDGLIAGNIYGGSINEQELKTKFYIPPSFPGPSFGTPGEIIMFTLVALPSGGPGPIAGLMYANIGSGYKFYLNGFYLGLPGDSTPWVEVPPAYILDDAIHEMRLRFDREGTYYKFDLDEETFLFELPEEEILPGVAPIFAEAFFGATQVWSAHTDVPNIYIDDTQFGFSDPESENGIYTVKKRIDEHRIEIVEPWKGGNSTNVHFVIQGGHSEFITDIHIDASGELDRELVGNLLALQRAPSEIFHVYLWSMVETFEAFNRWGILIAEIPEDITIKQNDDGEYYVEIISQETASNQGIGTFAGPPLGTNAVVFETTIEFNYDDDVSDFYHGFVFNTGNEIGSPDMAMYGVVIGYAQIDPDGAKYFGIGLSKWFGGGQTYLKNFFTNIDEILANVPQLQQNVKNMLRVVVEKRGIDNATYIAIYLNGQFVFDFIDETNPIPIRPGYGIYTERTGPSSGTITLKVYDFKFAPIEPMEVIKIGIDDEIEIIAPFTPEPGPETFDYESFETFAIGAPVVGFGYYGDFKDVGSITTIPFQVASVSSADSVSGSHCAENDLSLVSLAAAEVRAFGLNQENFLTLDRAKFYRNHIHIEIKFKGNLPWQIFDGYGGFNGIFKVFQVCQGSNTLGRRRELRLHYLGTIGSPKWVMEIYTESFDGSGATWLAKNFPVDNLASYFNNNWHTIYFEFDRSGTYIRAGIDESFAVEVTPTDAPFMAPISSLIDGLTSYIQASHNSSPIEIPDGSILKFEDLKIISYDDLETFEDFSDGVELSNVAGFYGVWILPGTPIGYFVSDNYSRPGGTKSATVELLPSIPADSQVFGSGLIAHNESAVGAAEFQPDYTKEKIIIEKYFIIPDCTGIGSGAYPLVTGIVAGGGFFTPRVLWFYQNSIGITQAILMNAIFGYTPTWQKNSAPGVLDPYIDGDEHLLRMEINRTAADLLFRVYIDSSLIIETDKVENPAMSPIDTDVSGLVMFSLFSNQGNPSPFVPPSDFFMDNIKISTED